MKRRRTTTDDTPGQDSFLDVVANIVGILIILVMVVGVRAANAPSELTPPDDATEKATADTRLRAQSLVTELGTLQQQSFLVQGDVEARRLEREQLDMLTVAAEKELESRRQMLDADTRRDFDLRRGLADAQADLQRLTGERIAMAASAPETVTIESLPTPLSKTVQGREVHFQLLGGRVVLIPLEKLLTRFESVTRQKLWKLADDTQMTDTVGPIDGFRLRYALQRFQIPLEVQLETGRGGSIVQLVRWELLPVSSQLGETVDTALSPGSAYQRAVASIDPHRTTVTIWTYPDSFKDFRRLKKELYDRGIPTAARPMPEGRRIGGSPFGSKSAAQ